MSGFATWSILINLRSIHTGSGFVSIQKGATLAEARVNSLRAAMRQLGAAGATGMGFVAVASAAVAVQGIRAAANLQDAMIQTRLATKMTKQEMEDLVPVAMKMSQSTAQSVTQSMELLRTLATSGINKKSELEALALPIARFADTQYLGKNHVAFNDSAATAAKIAHMLGARTAAELTPVLDQLYRMSNDMPDSIRLAANQLRMFAPFFKAAGVSNATILNLQATADRLGMGGGFGGAGLAQLYNVISNAPSKKAAIAQGELGLLDSSGGSRFIDRKTGRFDVLGLFQYLNEQRHKASNQRDFDVLLSRAFSSQNARRVARMFSSDVGLAQYRGVVAQQQGMANVAQAQHDLMESLNNQTKLMVTNFETMSTIMMSSFIPGLTSAATVLATFFGNAADYLQKHPTAAKAAATAVTVGSVSMGIGAAAIGAGMMGISSGALVAGLATAALETALALTGPAGLAVAAGALGVVMVAHALKYPPINNALATFLTNLGKSDTGLGDLANGILKLLAILHLVPGTVNDPNQWSAAHRRMIDDQLRRGHYGIGPRDTGWHIGNPLQNVIDNWRAASGSDPALSRIRGLSTMPGAGANVKAPTSSSSHGKQVGMVLHAHYHAPAGSNDAESRRTAMAQARLIAQQVAEVFSRESRTGIRSAGKEPQMFGMSPFEVVGQAV